MNRNKKWFKNIANDKKSLIHLSIPLLFFFLFFACQREPMVLEDSGIYPEKDRYSLVQDSITNIRTYVKPGEPLPASNRPISVLGSYYDPVFGKTTAGFATQLTVSTTLIDTISQFRIDSVVLDIFSDNTYGDTLYRPNVKVYQLQSHFSYDTSYYSDFDPFAFDPEPKKVGESRINPGSDSLFSIRLDHSVGEHLFSVDTSNLENQTAFAKFFNGLFLEAQGVTVDNPDRETGSLMQINLLEDRSQLMVYYNDTMEMAFPINDNCAQVNIYNNSYDQAAVKKFMDDTTLDSDYTYIQGLSGVETRISIPQMDSIRNSLGDESVALNKAELVIEKADSSFSFIDEIPERIILYESDDEGSLLPISDYRISTNDYDGKFYADSNAYYFNITKHLQDYITGQKSSAEMILRPSRTTVSPERVVLKSPHTGGIYLKLYYHRF